MGTAAGRKPFAPTLEDRKIVEVLTVCGTPHPEIAAVIKNPENGKAISVDTLEKYFHEELTTSATRANGAVGASLYNKARGESPQAVAAAIWWTKSRMGWKERTVVDVEVKSGVLIPPPAYMPAAWIEAAAAANAVRGEPEGAPEGEDDEVGRPLAMNVSVNGGNVTIQR